MMNHSWGASDDVMERYASSAPDPYRESYYNHCDGCEETGEDPGTFADYKARAIEMERKSRLPLPPVEEVELVPATGEDPF